MPRSAMSCLLKGVHSQAGLLKDHLAAVALECQQGFLDVNSQRPLAAVDRWM
jgi:hypothetical protein